MHKYNKIVDDVLIEIDDEIYPVRDIRKIGKINLPNPGSPGFIMILDLTSQVKTLEFSSKDEALDAKYKIASAMAAYHKYKSRYVRG